jgi:DNA-binding beta-propeller fold protein YncE
MMRSTSRSGLVALLVMVVAGIGVVAAEHYAKVAEIKIGGAGAFDYLTVDSAAKRLYVTHGTEIVVIDLATNAIVGRIADTPRVHGIAIGANGRGFTSNGGENKVGIVDLKTLATLSKVDTGANPDAILYVPSRKEVYAFNHTGESATIIDAEKGTAITTVKLGGQAETGQADAALGKVFVNIEDKSTVDVIDMASRTVVATWPVAPAEEPTGMAIDPATHRLFVGGGPSLVMLDANSGKVVASLKICGGTDATAFDPATKNVFVSCGDGHITVAHEDSPTALSLVETFETSRGARTMALDPATHRVYTAAVDFGAPVPNAPPPPPGRRGGPPPIPDSFHVMVFGPK